MSTEISKGRFVAALVVAVASDAVSMLVNLVLPIQWALDIVTAVLLFAILGKRWQLLPALVAEAIPVVAAFPSWVLVVFAIQMSQNKTGSPSIPSPQPTERKHVDNTAQQ